MLPLVMNKTAEIRSLDAAEHHRSTNTRTHVGVGRCTRHQVLIKYTSGRRPSCSRVSTRVAMSSPNAARRQRVAADTVHLATRASVLPGLRAHQNLSEAIRGHLSPPEAISGHLRPSEAIRGHPRPSEAAQQIANFVFRRLEVFDLVVPLVVLLLAATRQGRHACEQSRA